MDLTDWVVLLAIAVMAIAFFCTRTGQRRTSAERSRHARGTRMLIQAAIALWGALFVLERTLVSPGSLPVAHLNPHTALAVVLALASAGCLWSIRGRSLLKPQRIFAC
ncbi:hypothetical protein [Paraburkholderia sacchari]|uniref:hypothetical protein n=1 Tax=Paraburkholderia sacchari TaxID=159450 RepID=UPI001BD0388A|nr:hypothetical protein [Paraburkholderia sacchari]